MNAAVMTLEMDAISVRTRKMLGVSLVLHVVFLALVILFRQIQPQAVTLTEISWVEPNDEPPAPPAPPSPAPRAPEQGLAPKPSPAKPATPVARPVAEPEPPRPPTGTMGRERAQKEVAASLTGATHAAESAVKNLSAALGTQPGETSPRPGRQRRALGQARGSADLASMGPSGGGSTTTADVGGSAVLSAGIRVGALTWGSGGGSGTKGGSASGTTGGTSSGAAAPTARTQASLLAVVRRYAAGIQFCYDNELKGSPGLRGKMVAAITVTASGQVVEARLVTDTLGSSPLSTCVLSQIRAWRFPAIDEGTVTFQAPFVFTPPKA